MRRSHLVAVLLASTLLACREGESEASDLPVPDAEDACAADVPVRLVAPPASWEPNPDDRRHNVYLAGSQVLYSWGSFPDDAVGSYLVERCGGPSQELALSEPHARVFAAGTAAGPRLYALASLDLFLVDRLDEPGLDIPRSVGNVDPGMGGVVGELFDRLWLQTVLPPVRPQLRVAGLGAQTWAQHVHNGEPLAPLQRFAEDFVSVVGGAAGEPWLVLFDTGELREIDPDTLEDARVQSGVRSFGRAPDGRRLVWQAIGDGVAEPVFLLDRDTGVERAIAVNDFVADSWGRKGGPPAAGRWAWTADGQHLGLVGPAGTLVAVVRADDGAAIEIPEHASFHAGTVGIDAPFHLTRLDGGERVDVLWDPAAGAPFEFHRGDPARAPTVVRVTDDAVLYVVAEELLGPLLRLDRATGERREVTPRFSSERLGWLADGRVVTTLPSDHERVDVMLVDPEAATTATLAVAANPRFQVDPERGVYYLDTRGERPGLWFSPFPPR